MRFHRPPGFRVGRVVVQDDDFVIVIVQPRQRVQRLDHHLRRFVVTGQMHRHARRMLGNRQPRDAPLHPPQAGRHLDAFGQDHGAGQQHQRRHGDHRHDVGRVHIFQRGGVNQRQKPGGDQHDHPAHHQIAGLAHARHAAQHQEPQQQAEDRRHQSIAAPFREIAQQPREAELGIAAGVEHAPIGADALFARAFPGLVIGFEQVIVPALFLREQHELAQEIAFIGGGGLGAAAGAPFRRPARLAHHDLLVGEFALDVVVEALDGFQAAADVHILPIGQQMDEDDIHILADLRRQHPGGPGLGGGDLDARRQCRAHPPDIVVQLVGRDIAFELGFVAHNDPVNGAPVGQRRLDAQFDAFLVLLQVRADPDAHRDRHAVAAGNLGHLVHAAIHRIGADMAGELGDLRQVAVNPLGRDILVLLQREDVAGIVGDAAHLPVPFGRNNRIVAAGPEQGAGAHHHHQRDGNAKPSAAQMTRPPHPPEEAAQHACYWSCFSDGSGM